MMCRSKYVFLAFAVSASTQAATYFVNINGNDSTSCLDAQDSSKPKRNLMGTNGGISCLGPGDTLDIFAGTYREDLDNWFDTKFKSGTASAPVTIRGHQGHTVVIGRVGINASVPLSYWIFDNLVFDGRLTGANPGHNTFYTGLMDHTTVRNSTIKNGPRMCVQGAGTFNLFQNVAIHDCGVEGVPHYDYGAYYSGADTIFEFIHMFNTGGYGFHIFNSGSNSVARNTVRYSKIHDCGGTEPSNAGIIISTGPNNKIYGNLIYNNNQGVQVSYRCHGCEVYNNTIYNNKGTPNYGLAISGDSNDVVVKNNIVYGNGVYGINDASTTGTVSHNHCDTDTQGCKTSGDPLFVNATNLDFRLTAASPVIDQGADVTSAGIDRDIAGSPRPQGSGYDIGAYEFGGGTPLPSADTAPPTVSITSPKSGEIVLRR